MPLPPKLLKKGVTDMLRISDARMSGTAYGSVVLHMSPEAAAGGLLALVQNGDIVEMDVSKGKLELLVSEKEIARRRKSWKKPKPQLSRGYWRLYFDHVNQAHEGADLDFLVGGSGDFVPRDNHCWEDWVTFALFWLMAAVVFYQVFTRYVLDDSAGWTEEIARYFLVAVVFIGASMSVRKNNHIQVDYFYRLMPRAMGRILSTAVDVVRCLFLGYAVWLTWLLLQRIGNQPMAVIDLPVGWVFSAMLFGFALMFLRSLQVAWRHWRQGYSILERPEFPEV
jgi:TRAP-type C4-dicarboxylate transport system permease small subunit